MKRIVLLSVVAFLLAGCGSKAPQFVPQTQPPTETAIPTHTEIQEEIIQESSNMIQLTIGENTILAELTDNQAASELAELLKNGPITMSASNYGGFEKVCSLGTRLTANDVQTTTQAGDIMLYSGNQIVIFYGSNSWAYTPLARVQKEDIPYLQAVLSGAEDKVTISLA